MARKMYSDVAGQLKKNTENKHTYTHILNTNQEKQLIDKIGLKTIYELRNCS